ncbi:MAG: ribosome-associated translation inhibitor RaiA [Actinomycetota bacterium]|nr:ribosome-associated translation inhibitor RaiA [Actinomycetota bacterium]
MDIVVRARQIELSDRFRELAAGKLSKLERYDAKCHRVDVEVSRQSNPRLADQAVQVELTCHGRGPVVRAEASADEKYAALDLAAAKLEERMRRAADRRRDHKKGRSRTAPPRVGSSPEQLATVTTMPSPGDGGAAAPSDDPPDDGPMIVRQKTHQAPPMTLDQALYEMELVGHDFYLFQDRDSGTPSVVYRRRGYDYGVLHLEVDSSQAASDASG